MKSKNLLFSATAIILVLLGLSAYKMVKDPWKVPEEYKNKKNTVQATDESLEYGKEIYDMSCASCHGKSGEGNGVKAKNLNIELFDLTSSEYHTKFTDGDIYYQSFIGRYKWHDFRRGITDEEDRWNVVNYIRSMNK